jgi:hypothetical protein
VAELRLARATLATPWWFRCDRRLTRRNPGKAGPFFYAYTLFGPERVASTRSFIMKTFVCLSLVAAVLAACSFRHESVVERPAVAPAAVVVTDPPPATAVVVHE